MTNSYKDFIQELEHLSLDLQEKMNEIHSDIENASKKIDSLMDECNKLQEEIPGLKNSFLGSWLLKTISLG